MDFSDSDETGRYSHTALKIFACNFFKACSSFLSYMSYCGLTGRTSCFVNVSDKVWRVSACTACPLLRSCLRSSMPLSGAEKDIKIRWFENNILCSQTGDARKSSCLLPGYYCVLLILHPAYREPCG